MKQQQSSKTFTMTLVALIATAFQMHGIPDNTNQWIIAAISFFGLLLVYIGQSKLLDHISSHLSLDAKDLLKGAVMAIGAALSSGLAYLITDTSIDWNGAGKFILTTFLLYLTKNFSSGQKTN